MQTVSQRSHQSRTWFDAAVVDNGDGTLAIAASTFWLHDTPYQLAAYTPTVGSGPFRIYIENVGGAADYLLDTTAAAVPTALRPGPRGVGGGLARRGRRRRTRSEEHARCLERFEW